MQLPNEHVYTGATSNTPPLAGSRGEQVNETLHVKIVTKQPNQTVTNSQQL